MNSQSDESGLKRDQVSTGNDPLALMKIQHQEEDFQVKIDEQEYDAALALNLEALQQDQNSPTK